MATKLALWFLPFLLFFLMNGHGISSRDLKVELQDHTDTNSQAYLTGYNTQKEMDSQTYLTGYNTQKEADSQSYFTGYNTQKNADSQTYLTGYNSQKEVNPQAYLTGYNTKKKADSQTYLTGYNTQKEADSQAYLTGYNTQKEADSQSYFTRYNTQKKADSQEYLTGYNSQKEVNPQAYLIGYNTQKEADSKAYLIGYNTQKKADSQAYLTGYNSQKEADSQAYLTGYNTKKEADSQSYFTGYNIQKKADSQAYLTGYNSQKEVNPQAYLTGYNIKKKADSQTYLTGYNTQKKENTQQYLPEYIATSDNTQSNYKTSKKHNHPSHHENNIKITRESKHNHPSHSHHGNLNQPYITSYQTSNAHDANKPNYLIGYRTSSHGPGKDILFWSTNKAYITGYTTTPRDAKKDQKESRYGIDTPYITQYGGGDGFKEDSDTPYIAQYGDAKKGPKESRYGTDEPYITQYGGDVGPQRDPNAPYIAQYGGDLGGSNKEIKKSATAQDSGKPDITNYGLHSKKTQGLKGGPPSSNVDHTEAFKVGFFAMDDLYIGNIMTLQFPVEEFSHFLSKKEADSIPFSIPQLPSVLQLFSISEDSAQAKSMRGTIEQCEAGTITGETKICANSLESMLEFVDNIIGAEEKHNIHTTSPSSGAPLQKYTILKISEDIYAPKWVACHPLPYPYGVYYCHFISTGTRVFKVLLDGENGDKVEALGVCHLDTSDWSPNHILFKQLGFMPGEAPVCHFFPVKHLMWVPQPSTATM